MRVNGTVINGIFKFDKGLVFTENDIIIDDNYILYKVMVPEVYGEVPGSSKSYKEYTLSSAISTLEEFELNSNVDKLVTAGLLKSILPNYLKGLKMNGEVETIDLKENTLDDYNETGLYLLEVSTDILDKIPTLARFVTKLMLKVYNTSQGVLQELVDYQTPAIYYSVLQDDGTRSEWKSVVSESVTKAQFDSALNTYNQQLQLGLSQSETIINELGTKYSFVDLTYLIEKEDPSKVNLPATRGLPILKVGVSYVYDSVRYQEFLTIDPTMLNITITSKHFKVNYDLDPYDHSKTLIQLTKDDYLVTELKLIKLLGTRKSF